jgi:anti-sigma regulatory factor (Ser/Thr protein kinase)
MIDSMDQFVVPAEPAAVRIARDHLREIARSWGFAAVVDDVVLCLSEVVTNSVTHAHATGTIVVSAWHTATTLRVEVADGDVRGPHLRVPDEALDPRPALARELDEHGRGLYLVQLLATRWGVETSSEGKCVWFEKDIMCRHACHTTLVGRADVDTVMETVGTPGHPTSQQRADTADDTGRHGTHRLALA